MTQQSAYSSMTSNSSNATAGSGGTVVEKQEAGPGQTGNGSETSSVKTLKDSSYSTATSSLASGAASNKPRSSETASAMRGGNDTEVIESLAFQGDCFVYFHKYVLQLLVLEVTRFLPNHF